MQLTVINSPIEIISPLGVVYQISVCYQHFTHNGKVFYLFNN